MATVDYFLHLYHAFRVIHPPWKVEEERKRITGTQPAPRRFNALRVAGSWRIIFRVAKRSLELEGGNTQ
jgi:hypothetical protein